jgi:hypothetical protein
MLDSLTTDHAQGAAEATTAGPQCIMVLGVHRSGTSALTRMLSMLGAQLPKHLMPANANNERGYWEPQRLVDLNDEILFAAGSRWDDLRAFEPRLIAPPMLADYKARIGRIIREEYGGAPIFVVKDPRICRLLPLWREVLDDLGVRVQFAITLRNPLEVALSLERRDGLPFAYGCMLWLRDALDAEYTTRGAHRIFVYYDDLLQQPAQKAASIMTQLVGKPPVLNEEIERSIASYIDPALQHHIVELKELRLSEAFYPWLSRAYEAFSALVRGTSDEEAQRELDRIRAEFTSASASFAPVIAAQQAALRSRDENISRLNMALTAGEADVHAREERIASLNRALSARDTTLSELNGANASLAQTLAELNGRIATLSQAVTIRAGEVATLKKNIAATNSALANRAAELSVRTETLRALYGSTSWRLTAPLRAAGRLLRKT